MISEDLISTANSLFQEISKSISTAIMSYVANTRSIDKTIDPPIDFINCENIRIARQKGKANIPEFGSELLNDQLLTLIDLIENKISFVLSRMKHYVGVDGKLTVYNHNYKPLIMIKDTIYDLIKEQFIALSFDRITI